MAPWATENRAITVAIALSLKFSKSLMASSAGTPIVVTQLSTFRCEGLSDAVELREWSGLLRLVRTTTAPADPATTTQARTSTSTRLEGGRVRGEVPSDSELLSLTLTRFDQEVSLPQFHLTPVLPIQSPWVQWRFSGCDYDSRNLSKDGGVGILELEIAGDVQDLPST